METEEERKSRLVKMVATTQLRLALEEQRMKEEISVRASEQGNVIGSVRIREYGSTIYVGLARAYHPLIQTSG